MKTSKTPTAGASSAPRSGSVWVGKTVDDEEMGRGRIIDETENCIGVRFNKERRVMRVHYIPKKYITPNIAVSGGGGADVH